MVIASKVYRLADKLPDSERFGLKSQITRAAVSIPSNIAEGSSRGTDKWYLQFIEIALGSAFELETQLLLIEDLKLADDKSLVELKSQLTEEQKMLAGFIGKLKAKS